MIFWLVANIISDDNSDFWLVAKQQILITIIVLWLIAEQMSCLKAVTGMRQTYGRLGDMLRQSFDRAMKGVMQRG